jgi:large-conductance mechanosensitive channel
MYGTLIQTILDFLIIAFTVFLAFRIIKKVGEYTAKKFEQGKELLQNMINGDEEEQSKSQEIAEEVACEPAPAPAPEPPAAPAANEEILTVLNEIKDLLKAQNANSENKES